MASQRKMHTPIDELNEEDEYDHEDEANIWKRDIIEENDDF